MDALPKLLDIVELQAQSTNFFWFWVVLSLDDGSVVLGVKSNNHHFGPSILCFVEVWT